MAKYIYRGEPVYIMKTQTRLEHCDKAIEHYSRAINLKPNFAIAYYRRGNTYLIKGNVDHNKDNYAHAIKDFTLAIAFKADFAEAYNGRGNVYNAKGDYDRAIGDYNKAIELNPDFVEIYASRGMVWLHLGEWESAKSDLTTAQNIGVDIIASFQNAYENVPDFEQKNGIQLPNDIAAMLTPQ